MKNLIGIEDFSKSEIDELIEVGKDIIDNKDLYKEKCKGKILATLFLNQVQEQDLVLSLLC